MKHYVIIEGSPTRQFYEGDPSDLDNELPRHQLLVSVSTLNSNASEQDENAENAHVTIELANDKGQTAELYRGRLPPIGARVTHSIDGQVLFVGSVATMIFGETVQVQVEA